MGSRDHSEPCEVCGVERGGLNDLLCECDHEERGIALPIRVDDDVADLRARISTLEAALREACDLYYVTPEQRAAGFDPVPRLAALRAKVGV